MVDMQLTTGTLTLEGMHSDMNFLPLILEGVYSDVLAANLTFWRVYIVMCYLPT